MSILGFRYLSVIVVLFELMPRGKAANASQATEKDGTLVVDVTCGDIDNTPADDVYIEAHGFVRKEDAMKSFILKMVHNGEYGISLSPGIYDVFVSEGVSVPRCKRLLIRPGLTTFWTLKLETDDVYANKATKHP